jgi:hypothetical protein
MPESRMRENRTYGSKGGRWRDGTTWRGLLVPGRCAAKRHHHGLVGTSTAACFVGPVAYLTHSRSGLSTGKDTGLAGFLERRW